jgi:phage shock protein PspC (stress-responsive transcriptional regulator)
MKKMTTVELGGMPLQVDEGAFAALRHYLDRAEARLANNPDRAEIIADLERSIGEKLARRGAAQRIVTRVDVSGVLQEIGGVDGEDFESAAPLGDFVSTRRFYRLHDGKHLSGLCAGLAAYSGIDVAWVRSLFVILGVFTGGLLVAVYVVLMFVVPLARTPAEIAAAHGRGAPS